VQGLPNTLAIQEYAFVSVAIVSTNLTLINIVKGFDSRCKSNTSEQLQHVHLPLGPAQPPCARCASPSTPVSPG
jgi:hypothetical protein